MSIDIARGLLSDGFGRVAEALPLQVGDLSSEQLAWAPGPDANPIGWLAWHLARVEDDHLAGVAGTDQVWVAGGWAEQFGLPFAPEDIGYGQSTNDVRQVRVAAHLLTGYYAAVHARTESIIAALTAHDLERIVDERWDPPVTAAVRVVSVLNDVTQHMGQISYVRGLLPG